MGSKEYYVWCVLKALGSFALNLLIHDMFSLIMIVCRFHEG